MKTLITGASSGIGYELAKLYGKHGWHVYACGRNEQALNNFGRLTQIEPLAFDVTDKDAVKQTAEHIDELDLLVLNAGTCLYVDNAKEFDGEMFEQVMQVNLISVGHCLAAWLPKLRTGGRVVLVSSSASFLALPRAEAYGASKAAITYLAQTLSVDLAKHNIEVSVVHPGFVKTPLTDKNDFDMPMRITAEQAAIAIKKGIDQGKFEICAPKRFTYLLKLFALLPFSLWRKVALRLAR